MHERQQKRAITVPTTYGQNSSRSVMQGAACHSLNSILSPSTLLWKELFVASVAQGSLLWKHQRELHLYWRLSLLLLLYYYWSSVLPSLSFVQWRVSRSEGRQ